MPLRILPEKDFFGRKEDLATLSKMSLDVEKGITQSVFLSGPRGIGKTELLKHLFNYLFWKQDTVAPFYYSLNNAVLSAADFSRDYLIRYICQRLAFEKKESALLSIDGLSLDSLIPILEERKALWAVEIIERYLQCKEHADSMRISLNAPFHSTLATGMSVAVMIDEFQRLNNLRISGNADSMLAALFEMPMSFRKTPHFITGNQSEIQEMQTGCSIARMDIRPIQMEDAALMFSSVLDSYGIKSDLSQYNLINHLGGNPFYIRCAAKAIGMNKKSDEKNCWKAYINDIGSGNIYIYWASVLKSFFPELSLRGRALEMLHRIYHSGESLTQQRIAKAFSLNEGDTKTITDSLYRSGLVHGEFGVFRAPDDRVLKDFIDCLFMREIKGRSHKDIETELLEKAADIKRKGISFEMKIPMVREAELVAAQCLEQIGKNLNLNPDVIGQLQMAVIEACINAMEHSKGIEKTIYLGFEFYGGTMEVSIESSGREFISRETGEQYSGRGISEESGRGWGIKLMKNFADSVRFEKTERGTKVILTKKVSDTANIRKGSTAQNE